jgi:enoyl-CoA hydratase/carnithine racemase
MATHTDARLRLSLQTSRGALLSCALLDDLLAQLENLKAGIPGLITLEGKVGSFCEGLDLERLSSPALSESERMGEAGVGLDRLARFLDRLAAAPRPVVALVDGSALGGGMGLLGAADLVLATPRSRFGLPESLVGLIPAVIFPWVARRIGYVRAQRLALGGRPLSAREALEWGLVDEVVDDLEAALAVHERRLLRMDPSAVRAIKQLTFDHFQHRPEYQAAAQARFLECFESPETRRRLTRFVEGLAPWTDGDGEVGP